MLCAFVTALLVLGCTCLQASIAAEDDHYNIGASERMSITGAVFHAYENAWSVSFLVPDVYSLLVFALCREPCPPVSLQYQLYGCETMLSVLREPAWYNQYLNSIVTAAEQESLCAAMRSTPEAVQTEVNKIVTDNVGGALVRLRHPRTLVIFYEEDVIQNWMTVTNDAFGVSFRATQIEIVGEHFGIRHYKDHVLLLNVTEHSKLLRVGLIFALRNVCTELGFSAPEYGIVRSVVQGGRSRCVWECRADMLRQPYNSAPPSVEQVNTSSAEYALLEVKYACVKLPKDYVAAVFGFAVETSLMPSDIGYEQALYDAIDRLSYIVKTDMAAAGFDGTIVFSIKNSIYHNSFSDRLSEQQIATCALANAAKEQCQDATKTIENSNYVYRRRLLTNLPTLNSSVLVEGVFITADKNKISSTEQMGFLRASLVNAIQDHAPVLGNLQNIENFDFSQITLFTSPVQAIITTPAPVPESTNTDETQVGLILLMFGLFFASAAVLAIYCVSKV